MSAPGPLGEDPLGGWPSLPGDSVPVTFSAHAVDRARQRLRPGADKDAVRRQLSQMLASARVTSKRPEWLSAAQDSDASHWLLMGEDYCLPLVAKPGGELRATTLMSRGSIAPVHRERLNAKRAERTARKLRVKKERSGKRNRRPPREGSR